MILKSYAKINLSLKIKGKRKDNYHLIDSVFLPIDIYDKIIVNKIDNPSKVLINGKPCSFSNNICQKVIDYLYKNYNITDNYEFNIIKNIPLGGGLGGGSSNACEIFKFYNKKYKLNISNKDAINILVKFGADIPFFLFNKSARIQGIGEKIKEINVKNNFYILLVNPGINISTKDVYDTFDLLKLNNKLNINKVIKCLEENNTKDLYKYLGNDLENPAFKINNKILNVKNEIKSFGINNVLMTGSGSTIFAISSDKNELKKVYEVIKKKYKNTYLIKSKY